MIVQLSGLLICGYMELHYSSYSCECIRSHLPSFTTDKCANTGKDAKGRYKRDI